jgi:hypothetical protein
MGVSVVPAQTQLTLIPIVATPSSGKIHLSEWTVKGKIAFGNSLEFEVRIEDLRLKWCILGRNSQNNITGRTSHPPSKTQSSLLHLLYSGHYSALEEPFLQGL